MRAGIDALTMRRLAQELGVEAMTLYYYVANKNEILNGIVDLVVSEMDCRDRIASGELSSGGRRFRRTTS